NIEAAWASPDHSAFFRRLASFCRVILFDKRGTGMSDRSSQIFTLEQRMHDVQAILDAVGCKRAALFGVSEGGPMSLLYAATYPARTSALVLYGSYAKRAWAPDYPFGWKDDQWERVFDNFEHHWGTAQNIAVTMYTPSLAGDPAGCERRAAYLRASASRGAAVGIMKMTRDLDVRHVLPAIRVPTLILHRTAEQVIDVANARYMAQHIPGAKLVELAGIDHNYLTGGRDALLDEVEVFLTGARHGHDPERVLATVLFADIVGSTERAAALGDHSWLNCSRHSTPRRARCCNSTAAVRSIRRATASSPPLTGRRARFAVPARSAIRCARSALTYAVACTPANASSSGTTLPESRCTWARASPVSRRRARCWSRRRSATSWPAPDWRSRNGVPTRSKACPTRGIYSGQSRAESPRAYSRRG